MINNNIIHFFSHFKLDIKRIKRIPYTINIYGSRKHSGIQDKALGHYNRVKQTVRRLGIYNNAVRKLGH